MWCYNVTQASSSLRVTSLTLARWNIMWHCNLSQAGCNGMWHCNVTQAARKLAITEVDLERAEARLEAAEAWVLAIPANPILPKHMVLCSSFYFCQSRNYFSDRVWMFFDIPSSNRIPVKRFCKHYLQCYRCTDTVNLKKKFCLFLLLLLSNRWDGIGYFISNCYSVLECIF